MTSSSRRRHLATAIAAGLAMFAPAAVLAQTAAPDKVLRIVAAGPAGGTLDVVSRMLADGLAKELNRPVVVDNKPGAGGALAVGDLMQAPHDGNTIVVSLNAMVSEIPHIVKLRFDMAKDVKPIAELARGGLVMVGNPAVPAKSVADVVSYVKANPGKVSYASYSPGTISHVMGLQLNKAAGIDMTHVGYKGSTLGLTDVMGGHIPLMFDGIPTSAPLIKSGKIVPYAVSLPQRSPLLPNVPTFTELGYPQLEAIAWMGVWVAPDVPAATQARLREASLKVMGSPAARERLREVGLDSGQARTPDELAKALASDYDRVGAILKSINFKPE